jgi:hypothetical protein
MKERPPRPAPETSNFLPERKWFGLFATAILCRYYMLYSVCCMLGWCSGDELRCVGRAEREREWRVTLTDKETRQEGYY